MINPKILSAGDKISVEWEGCLSVDNGELFGPVKRSKYIEIEYLGKDMQKKRVKAHGMFSHVIQHEIDHLNGIMFISYISNPDKLWTSSDLDKYIDEYGTLPDID